MATDPTPDLMGLPAELRNEVWSLVLEYEKSARPGDNRATIVDEKDPFSVDWQSLEKTRLPAIVQINQQARADALPMVGQAFCDYFPALKVFEFRGDKFGSWLDVFGKHIVPHLRHFAMDTRTARVIVVLDGTEDEVAVVESVEVHETSSTLDGMAVAVTHFQGHVIDEDIPNWLEYAPGEILEKLEELLPASGPRRLSVKGLKRLARFCEKKLERGDDESDEE
ncbi:hypothetical protein PRZ48_007861 [Zasmidium cellare]|uniref:Uncharacterized protein n=1 Tax=Zasmidium cellare TaxID=395010 RepID=A0ABR0ELK2_ZASCE|nr:hypothetical protein PRZ48_007861 [Zasmidium cellare]